MPNPFDPNNPSNPQNPNNPMATPQMGQQGNPFGAGNPFAAGGPLAQQNNPSLAGGANNIVRALMQAKMMQGSGSTPMSTPEFSTASPANPYANGMFGMPGGAAMPNATGSVGAPPGAANIWSQGTGAVPFTDQTMAGLFPAG